MDKKDMLPTKKNVSGENRNTIFLITYAIFLIMALLNMNATMSFLGWVLAILNPFLLGLIIAFIINIIMTRLETKVFAFLDKPKFKIWQKSKRGVCLTLSFLIIILVVTALVFFIGPQLAQSVQLLSGNLPIYISYMQQLTNSVLGWFNLTVADLGNFAINWNDLFGRVSSFLANVSPSVLNFATGFTSAIFNFFMGLIFAIYLLVGKESFICSFKRTLEAFLPQKTYNSIIRTGTRANDIFTSFVVGQLTEAVILGVMYFIGTSIFRMPYAPLIATLMGICSLIPMFGPIIGAIPSAFILLMVKPSFAIIFIVMAVVFQQIEGNFIYPKVVGSSVGLPGMWVLFAILVGGSLFGAFGMILAVPFASLLYALLRDLVNHKLQKKHEESSRTVVNSTANIKKD